MPYVTKEDRAAATLMDLRSATAGQLNFLISSTIDKWLGDEISYDRLQDVVSVLECVPVRKGDVERFVADDYDDTPTADLAGDIYGLVQAWLVGNPPWRALGVLTCVREEFYRRVVVPYEDFKCALNGDVYRRRHYG